MGPPWCSLPGAIDIDQDGDINTDRGGHHLLLLFNSNSNPGAIAKRGQHYARGGL
jgi:hypothetical protein